MSSVAHQRAVKVTPMQQAHAEHLLQPRPAPGAHCTQDRHHLRANRHTAQHHRAWRCLAQVSLASPSVYCPSPLSNKGMLAGRDLGATSGWFSKGFMLQDLSTLFKREGCNRSM